MNALCDAAVSIDLPDLARVNSETGTRRDPPCFRADQCISACRVTTCVQAGELGNQRVSDLL
jgi:hypothetical protein